jgi:hypothetical protein
MLNGESFNNIVKVEADNIKFNITIKLLSKAGTKAKKAVF